MKLHNHYDNAMNVYSIGKFSVML